MLGVLCVWIPPCTWGLMGLRRGGCGALGASRARTVAHCAAQPGLLHGELLFPAPIYHLAHPLHPSCAYSTLLRGLFSPPPHTPHIMNAHTWRYMHHRVCLLRPALQVRGSSYMFLTGPDVVKSVTMEDVTQACAARAAHAAR